MSALRSKTQFLGNKMRLERMLKKSLCVFLLAPIVACADSETEVFSCLIENSTKTLSLSETESDLNYRFGPKDAPELVLSAPKDSAKHTPWNGIGRTIWEAVAFEKDNFIYEVWTALDKFDAIENPDKARSAGVTVYKDGEDLATFQCDPRDLDFPAFVLDDALNEGQ